MTVKELLGILWDSYEVDGKRCLTTARSQVKPLLAALGGSPANGLTGLDVQRYELERSRAGAAEATVRNELFYLRRAYRVAIELGTLEPTSEPRIKVKRIDNRRTESIDPESFHRILRRLDTLNQVIGDLVRFYWLLGWRRREVLEFLWSHVDRPARLITLPGILTKNKRPRYVPITAGVAEVLDRREADRSPETEHVFHRDGQPVKCFRGLWRRACQPIRPGLRIHDLRRSFARQMVPIAGEKLTMEIGGWLDVRTFHGYLLGDEEGKRRALEERDELDRRVSEAVHFDPMASPKKDEHGA